MYKMWALFSFYNLACVPPALNSIYLQVLEKWDSLTCLLVTTLAIWLHFLFNNKEPQADIPSEQSCALFWYLHFRYFNFSKDSTQMFS